MKTYSGFTGDTAKHLLLDSGAFFKNFNVGTDTFESAKAAGKLIGATSGGGEFSAVPESRQIEIDGVKGRAKGLTTIDSWEVYLKATFVEVKPDLIKMTLGSGQAETVGSNTVITAKNNIELTDYINNITWVGTLSGSDTPVIIQVYNALATDGLTFSFEDKNQAGIEVTFYGSYTQEDLDTPPFEIVYPSVSGDTGYIEFNTHSISISETDTYNVSYTVSPSDATITWSSADSTVASVSNGVITGAGAGDTIITASITVDNVEYTDTCTVVVTA